MQKAFQQGASKQKHRSKTKMSYENKTTMNKTYLNRNVVELCDKSMFDPIHKVLRRQHSQQVRTDNI